MSREREVWIYKPRLHRNHKVRGERLSAAQKWIGKAQGCRLDVKESWTVYFWSTLHCPRIIGIL